MEQLFDFLKEHGVALLSLLAATIYFTLRFVKTGRSYDFLRWLLNVLDSINLTKDRKSGGGRHVNRSNHVD